MPPEYSRRAEPSTLPEWMDEPCTYADFRACLVDLRAVNRLTLGYRPTLAWLDSIAASLQPRDTLRIVDVGCGGGDLLRAIAAWARARGVNVGLTGVDLNPFAARAAREFAAAGERIDFVTADAFACPLPDGADIIVSSLFTHHLETPEVVRFVAWMEATASLGWFVNDLERSRKASAAFTVLANLLRWHRFVRHDGPVSFQRAFRAEDWSRICQKAGIAPERITIESWRPGRLCVGRRRTGESDG